MVSEEWWVNDPTTDRLGPIGRDLVQRRSTKVVATGVAVFAGVALAVWANSEPDPDYQGVCVDKTTEERVGDDECDDGHSSTHGFLFLPVGAAIPALGQSIRGYQNGTYTVPDGHVGVKGGAPINGGVVTKQSAKEAVSRGGFGTSGNGGSVGG